MIRSLVLATVLMFSAAQASAECGLFSHQINPTEGDTTYYQLGSIGAGQFGTTESTMDDAYSPHVAIVASNLYAYTNVAPGSGESWTITLRQDASDTTLTCTISNTETTCTDIVNAPTLTADGSHLNMAVADDNLSAAASGQILVSFCWSYTAP
jgi:hypothetical protein